ncbi:MAG: hypothetical protein SCALA702_33050 [Melioribacteraceae bacterium]|nr:MAG: hypothetical protein SCALA702_33050 [Melioribacteraceae bacterium]
MKKFILFFAIFLTSCIIARQELPDEYLLIKKSITELNASNSLLQSGSSARNSSNVLEFQLETRNTKYYLGEYIPLKININNQGGNELGISGINLILENKNSGKIETQGLPNRGQSEMVILPGENYLEIILNTTITFRYYSEYRWPIVPVGDYHLYLIQNGEKISNSVDLTVLPIKEKNINAFEALNLSTLTYLADTKICLQAYDGLKQYENSIFQYEHYIRAINNFVIPVATTVHDHKEFVESAKAILKKYLELREFDNYAYDQLLRIRAMNMNFENDFLDSIVAEYEKRKELSKYSGNRIVYRFKD